jgi:hypothetical protein
VGLDGRHAGVVAAQPGLSRLGHALLDLARLRARPVLGMALAIGIVHVRTWSAA